MLDLPTLGNILDAHPRQETELPSPNESLSACGNCMCATTYGFSATDGVRVDGSRLDAAPPPPVETALEERQERPK